MNAFSQKCCLKQFRADVHYLQLSTFTLGLMLAHSLSSQEGCPAVGLAVVLLRRANRRRGLPFSCIRALFCSGVCCANGKGPCITAVHGQRSPWFTAWSQACLRLVYTGPSVSLEPEQGYHITAQFPETGRWGRWWRIWGWLGSCSL